MQKAVAVKEVEFCFVNRWFIGAIQLAKSAPTVIPRKRMTSRHASTEPLNVSVVENRRAG
jgi:hypothetical protein